MTYILSRVMLFFPGEILLLQYKVRVLKLDVIPESEKKCVTKTQNKKKKTVIVNSQVFTNRGIFVYTKKYFSITIRPFTESL